MLGTIQDLCFLLGLRFVTFFLHFQSDPIMPPKRRRVENRATPPGSDAQAVPGLAAPGPSVTQPIHPTRLQPSAAMPNLSALSQDHLASLSTTIATAVVKAIQDIGSVPTSSSSSEPHMPTSSSSSEPQIQFVPDPVPAPAPASSSGLEISRSVSRSQVEENTHSMVTSSVEEAVQQLTGTVPPTDTPRTSKNSFLSAAIPLGQGVPQKVNAQIWANEYVDFTVLLNNTVSKAEDEFVFKIERSNGGQPSIVIAPNQKKQSLQTIDQWQSAFQVFVATYSEKAPHDTPALMKYASVVKELATQGANWHFSDEHFRRLRENQGAPWDQIHSELWLRAHSFRAKTTTSGKPKATSPFVPWGYCWKFHKDMSCNGCSYLHQCFRCGQQHTITKCRQPSKSTAGPNPTKFSIPHPWSTSNTSQSQ